MLAGCSAEPDLTPTHIPLTAEQARPLTERTFAPTPARAERGQYLVEGALRCFTCHSPRDWDAPGAPPVEGMQGAGAVMNATDSTRVVASNLTPDDATGIGRWTDDMLARAIREGVGHDGRVLNNLMPYGSYRRLSDEDLAAVVVYLRSLPPVRNPLPPTVLTEARQERLAALLSPLTEPVPVRDLTDPMERGRYLLLLADCEGCHTSWYSERNPGLLGGGNYIEWSPHAAFTTNITAHASGMHYGAEAFIGVIRTGKGGTLSPLMPWTAYQHMTDDDLRAIHAFLHSMQPIAHHLNNLSPPTPCAVCGQTHGLGDLNRIERPEGIAADTALFGDYVGVYHSPEFGFTIRVSHDGDHLVAQEDDGPVAELIPQSDTRFLMLGGLAPLRFERDSAGAVTRLVSEEVEELGLERVADGI